MLISRKCDLKPIILVVLGAWLLRVSWHKWTNITLDYGRELYTPWRITCGQVLYKDIASLFGPFPPYWNALLFKIFGTSIMTLVLFNILLVTGITVLIYRFFSHTMDKQVAFFASAIFLSIFAFEQSNMNIDQGNFTYICPYTYSVTYAVLFSLWAIELFAAQGRSGKDAWWGAVGALIGLTALCRFEIFIFLAMAIVLGFISRGIIGRWPLKRFLKAGGLALAGFFVPVGTAYLYFLTQLPLSQVWPSILGFNHHWLEILHNTYYWRMIGLEDPLHNFIIMLATTGCYCFVFIVFKCLCMGVDRIDKSGKRWEGAIFVLLGLGGIAQVTSWILYFHDDHIFKGLPLVVILMVIKARRNLPLLVMAVWGLLMLTKVFLKVQINSEGFVYAMPAALLFVVLFQGFVPRHFERVHARGHFVSTVSAVLLGFIMIVGLRSMAHVYQSRNFQVRAGPDIMICNRSSDAAIEEISAFLKDADKIMGKGANFAVFPEGVMLNFLTKRIDPLPYISFKMVERINIGNQEMLRSFKEHRPDYVIMYHQFLPAYFSPGFALSYPRSIIFWILANYSPVWPAHPEIGNMLTVFKRSE